ncbi:hypothetical protein [Homoserinibacter sp. YIM 151385]|uniref:hypothetical protein n=1 Tax=Homoserinibacter sp. YIM 151385 TaxID=2985506 RepID=UPI0022F06EC3|nr:hypothetical protein [Homoserinibacter sp. YIM 151385]WBU37912.1 hypothetical protein OF852_13495 [Homoserinibacter sp. YIM 151385]
MEFTGGSTGIMLLVAAVLWFAYLVPTWVRRSEYLATERNATRLQQTLRIMAESAEVPEQVRLEVRARDAAAQERVLRAREKEAELRRRARERAALEELARHRDPLVERVELARRRQRRTRLAATLVLLGALAAAGIQIVLMATTGAVAASWAVLAVAGVAVSLALGTHRQLAKRRIRLPRIAEAATPRRRVERRAEPVERAEPRPAADRSWTPVPVPRPRYLGQPEHQELRPQPDAEQLMRDASEAAQAALRAAHRAPEVLAFPMPTEPVRRRAETPAPVPAAPAAASASTAPARPAATGSTPAAPSRWSRMGLVDDLDAQAAPDVDAMLRRRRAAG